MKFIALFRGINVGGRNILPMKSLVEILDGLGYTNIQTYIQSGNVVFESASNVTSKETKLIQNTIEEQHGFKPLILFIKSNELNEAINNNIFDTKIGKSLHLSFCDEIPKTVDYPLFDSLKAKTEEYKLHGKVFYLYAPDGIGRSKLAMKVEKILEVNATSRNWNTVMKLKKMVNS